MASFIRGVAEKAVKAKNSAVEGARKQRQSTARQRASSVSVEINALKLVLVSGQGLKAADKNGKSDPYVKIYAGNYKLKSKTKYKTLNPDWGQIFYLQETQEKIRFDVYDKDKLDSDDFLGWCELDASDIAGEKLDTPKHYVLDVYEHKGQVDVKHGTIKVTLARTRILANKLSSKNARREFAKKIGKRRVMVDVIEGRNLLAADSDDLSDPYVKIKIGKKKAKKTSIVYSNRNPIWNERLQFDVPEDSTDVMIIQVFDRDVGFNNDDLIGKCEIEWHELDTNVRNDDYFRLYLEADEFNKLVTTKKNVSKRQEAGWIKLGLTLLEQGKPIKINKADKVTVEVVKAVKMKAVEKAFVEIELGPSLIATDRVAAKDVPKWESIYQLPIIDVYQDVILTVYSGDYDDKKFLGRVMIPVLEIQDEQQEFYVLKDEDCNHPVGGELQLAFEAQYASSKPYWHLIKRHEVVDYSGKIAQQKGGLLHGTRMLSKKVSRIRGHGKRLSKLIGDVKALIAPVKALTDWVNVTNSVLAMICWIPICYFWHAWMLPCILASYLGYNYYSNNKQKVFTVNEDGFYVSDFVKDQKTLEEEAAEQEEEEMENEEEETTVAKKEPTMKNTAVKSALRYANMADIYLDFVASLGERAENLANWTTPQITRVFLIGFTVLTVILLVVPFNFFVMIGGEGFFAFKFYKTKIKKPKTEKQKLKKPSNELINMIYRLPTHQLIRQRARFRPHTVEVKKSNMDARLDTS